MQCTGFRAMAVALAMVAGVVLGDDYDWNYDKTARTAADDEVSSVGSLANGTAVPVPLAVADAGDAGDLDSRWRASFLFDGFTYLHVRGFFLMIR